MHYGGGFPHKQSMKRIRTDDPPVRRRSKRLAAISDLADFAVLPSDVCRHILAFACRGLVDKALFQAQYGYDFSRSALYKHVPRCAFVSTVQAVADSVRRHTAQAGPMNWTRLMFRPAEASAKRAVLDVIVKPNERFDGEVCLLDFPFPECVDIMGRLRGVVVRRGAPDFRRCERRVFGHGQLGLYGVPMTQLEFTIAAISKAVNNSFNIEFRPVVEWHA